jgi:hypothetical protein
LEHIAEEIRLYIPTFVVLEERINNGGKPLNKFKLRSGKS